MNWTKRGNVISAINKKREKVLFLNLKKKCIYDMIGLSMYLNES